ncbi:MAG TPA: DUF5916 domain-containing protein [Thermoanaerobaculia bacterium]|nr:DUF5916 domain-containing protein [Thermoanaerobaculia bacterium]
MKRAACVAFLLLSVVRPSAAQPVVLAPTEAAIQIDGNLSDAVWQNATKYEIWYETNPGDNIEPSVKTVGYVTYDSRFLYFGVESIDPNPGAISAPFADHDQISGNTDDYVGVLLDTRNDGKSGYLFLLTARGVQYDAITDDAGNGEDNSPDFFWDSEARIHEKGWTAEARIPFSSLRYDGASPEQWGLMLYRNYPRDRRYQMFTNKLPRDKSCFVCSWGKVTGLRGLPTGDHMVIAPYATANQVGQPRDEVLGNEFVNRPVGAEAGLDFKWSPTADMAVDATINPDFSQIESDVAVISTNERFAIFIPEKRPFFLEGVDLFSTPIQAVYTRTITAPRWGARTTGKTGDYAYTLLVAQDRGGGDVILPSAFGSDFAQQDFSSLAAIGRLRRDFGQRSHVSFLATTREAEGGAHNRVFGPDFQWRINDNDTLTGQVLYSSTQNPDRPDLSDQWTGQKRGGHAAHMWFSHNTAKNDFYVQGSDYDGEFRADNGFVPQVGWRGGYMEGGHTWRPKGFFSRVRAFGMTEYQQTQGGDLLYRLMSAGIAGDGKRRSFTRIRLAKDSVAAGIGEVFDRDRIYYQVQFAVSRVISFLSFDGWVGDEVDFSQNRLGRGASVNSSATLRPSNHLQLGLTSGIRWLNIDGDRLFTSQVERLRATYTFNPRMFVRAIVQNERTNRDQALYGFGPQYTGGLAAQGLFAYKLNWQTVFYVGFGDLREVTTEEGEFEPSSRQFFAKISYAFQR